MTDTTKIYVDLASLLDLRQGTLYYLVEDKEKLAKYIQSEEYNFRETDTFPIVNQEEFDKLYKSADIKIIPQSIVTHILVTIQSKLANLGSRNAYYGETKTPEVMLNVYPYKLTEEQSAQLQNMLFVKLNTNTMVTITSMTPQELSPYFIKTSSISAAFIYDIQPWLDAHGDKIENVKLPDTILYFPSLFKEAPTKEDKEKIEKMGFKDIFSYTEYLFSTSVSLNFLPTLFYTNLVTANSYLTKFNEELKDTPLSNKDDDTKYQDIAEKVDAATKKEQ